MKVRSKTEVMKVMQKFQIYKGLLILAFFNRVDWQHFWFKNTFLQGDLMRLRPKCN